MGFRRPWQDVDSIGHEDIYLVRLPTRFAWVLKCQFVHICLWLFMYVFGSLVGFICTCSYSLLTLCVYVLVRVGRSMKHDFVCFFEERG